MPAPVSGEIDAALFASTGVEIIPRLIDARTCDALGELLDPLLEPLGSRRPGARRVLQRAPRVVKLLGATPVPSLLGSLLGADWRVVRAILFDKSPESNWLVPWHQDPTIAVRDRVDVPGFGPWNCKEDQHHCQPPVPVLDSIVILRLHLDPCPAESGPLRVFPSSHTRGILSPSEVDALVASQPPLECSTPRGGAVFMKPLTVHSSAKAAPGAARRRILHLEVTALRLPAGLEWAESVSLAS